MQCKARNQSGGPCKAPSQGGSEFCFIHDPRLSEARKAAQRKGGQARARSVAALPVGEIDLSDPTKIPAEMTRVATLVCSGRLDAKQAHAVGHLADCSLKAFLLGAQQQKLDHIARLLEEQRNRPADLREVERMLHFVPVDDDKPAELPQRRDVASAESHLANGDQRRDRNGEEP